MDPLANDGVSVGLTCQEAIERLQQTQLQLARLGSDHQCIEPDWLLMLLEAVSLEDDRTRIRIAHSHTTLRGAHQFVAAKTPRGRFEPRQDVLARFRWSLRELRLVSFQSPCGFHDDGRFAPLTVVVVVKTPRGRFEPRSFRVASLPDSNLPFTILQQRKLIRAATRRSSVCCCKNAEREI